MSRKAKNLLAGLIVGVFFLAPWAWAWLMPLTIPTAFVVVAVLATVLTTVLVLSGMPGSPPTSAMEALFACTIIPTALYSTSVVAELSCGGGLQYILGISVLYCGVMWVQIRVDWADVKRRWKSRMKPGADRERIEEVIKDFLKFDEEAVLIIKRMVSKGGFDVEEYERLVDEEKRALAEFSKAANEHHEAALRWSEEPGDSFALQDVRRAQKRVDETFDVWVKADNALRGRPGKSEPAEEPVANDHW